MKDERFMPYYSITDASEREGDTELYSTVRSHEL
jgi:hypothetical protein